MLPLLNQDNLIWNDHISQHNPNADCPIYFDGYDDISRYIKLNSLGTNLLQKINQVFQMESKIGTDFKRLFVSHVRMRYSMIGTVVQYCSNALDHI